MWNQSINEKHVTDSNLLGHDTDDDIWQECEREQAG